MARMHSRDKGKSTSRKPLDKKTPTWLTYKEKEVEMLVTKLSKEGKSTAEIGLILRDSYGIPSVSSIANKKIGKILVEKKLIGDFPEDMMNLMKRSVKLRKHQESNKKDMSAKRGVQLTDSKILRLAKYYKKTGKLAQEWKFSPEELKLIASD